MEQERVKQLMTQADATLGLASEEQMKPAEDVVHYSICHNSRLSIRMYLISYLLKHKVEPQKSDSIKDLVNRCIELDDRFSKINLTEMQCSFHKENNNQDYCLSLNEVGNCFKTAEVIREMIYDLD